MRVALDHLDAVISLIRNSQTAEIARTGLIEQFSLTEKQAQAILDMRLQRLTGLEREKIEEEYQSLVKLIAELKDILANEYKVLEIIREELTEIKERFNDERRTEIVTSGLETIEDEDLIERKYRSYSDAQRIRQTSSCINLPQSKRAEKVYKVWEQTKMISLNI